MSHYQTLGIPETADLQEVKRAYRRLVMELHPDRNGGKEVGGLFEAVQEAYRVLSDVALRRVYDQQLLQGRARTRPIATTATEVYAMAYELQERTERSDPDRIDRDQLELNVLSVLSVYHIQLLNREANMAVNNKICAAVLICAAYLDKKAFSGIITTLEWIEQKNMNQIDTVKKKYHRQYYWHIWKIPLALLIALIFCWIIYRS
jgi:curved DNA-binding protein CbpA